MDAPDVRSWLLNGTALILCEGGNLKANVALKIQKRHNYKTMRDVNLNALHVSFVQTF